MISMAWVKTFMSLINEKKSMFRLIDQHGHHSITAVGAFDYTYFVYTELYRISG